MDFSVLRMVVQGSRGCRSKERVLAATAVRSLGAKSAESQAAPVREWFTAASRAAARERLAWKMVAPCPPAASFVTM
jgi:hypothetical protein